MQSGMRMLSKPQAQQVIACKCMTICDDGNPALQQQQGELQIYMLHGSSQQESSGWREGGLGASEVLPGSQVRSSRCLGTTANAWIT